MKRIYDNAVTRYYCKRCRTPIDVESDSFYWFSSPDDPAFWCPACEDLPQAEVLGTPAKDLPTQLILPQGFVCRPVPLVEPSEVRNANLLYRPYSKRSFLRQYADWLVMQGVDPPCLLRSQVLARAAFDSKTQEYTEAIEYQIADRCGERDCAFLRQQAISPVELECEVGRLLCDTHGEYGLCQTGDEAMLLTRYLTITGAEHYPMLIPQPSIFKGRRRPDFLCFIPYSKFQYRKVAILVDRSGKDSDAMAKEDAEYREGGYEVRRIEVGSRSYYKEARELANWIESIP